MFAWHVLGVGTISSLALLGMTAPSVPGRSGPAASSANDIAFASRRDGNWEIYVMDAAGQNQR
ncbi:MAG: hypothetical protein ACREOJ_18095, partial [Gemmatimonadaceae bacterium]